MYTLLIITARDCSFCVKFKLTDRNNVLDEIKKIPDIDVKEIDLPSMRSRDKLTSHHPELSEYVRWFPCFVLVETDSLKSGPLRIVSIMGGEVVGTQEKVKWDSKRGYGTSPEFVSSWIQSAIQSKEKVVPKGSGELKNLRSKERKIVVLTSNGRPLPSGWSLREGDEIYTHRPKFVNRTVTESDRIGTGYRS